jgi:ABC-type uncharacterized transport system permease subunit
MGIWVSGLLSIVLYLAASAGQARSLQAGHARYRRWVLICGLAAAACHAWFVLAGSFTGSGVAIDLASMASLVSWAIAVTVLVTSVWKPLENLLILFLPLAAAWVGISLHLADASRVRQHFETGLASHILLSVLAYSFLTIAAMHSLVVQYQHRRLKRPGGLSLARALPSLQTMDYLLFVLLWVGWTLLTLSIVSGLLYLEDMFAQHLVHHTVITLSAWAVFLVLLGGRVWLGWRGRIASAWTLAGFFLLALGYFGSKFVLEVLLQRT